jgi:hypothetical protein
MHAALTFTYPKAHRRPLQKRQPMAEQTYRLVFQGKLAQGQDPAIVKERLAKLFKVDRARTNSLFSGSPVVVKNKLPLALAEQYKQKFVRTIPPRAAFSRLRMSSAL